MNVVDLHPEELIDKLSEGELSVLERERLDAHLAQCSSCRFETSVRADLERDAPHFEPRAELTFTGQPGGGSHFSAMHGAGNARAAGSLRVRSRRRWPLLLLAGSLVLCAGGAMAAVLTGAVTAPAWLQRTSTANGVRGTRAADDKLHPRVSKSSAATPSAAPVAAAPRTSDSAVILEPSAAPTLALRGLASVADAGRPIVHRIAARPPAEADSSASVAPLVTTFPALPAAGASAVQAGHAGAALPQLDPAATMFADANRARRDGNIDRAVALYRSLQARFPSSSESELSRALLAQLLLDRGKPEEALAGFDHYLSEGAPVLSAEAWVGRARALEQLGKPEQARTAWRQVQDRFPGSVHARLAATRLAALGMR